MREKDYDSSFSHGRALRKRRVPLRFNNVTVKEGLSNDTISEVTQDYFGLTPEIYRAQCFVSEKNGNVSSTDLLRFVRKKGYCETMVNKGYDTLDRVETIINEFKNPEKGRSARPTMLARAFIGQKWNLKKSTVDSYIKRGRRLPLPRKTPQKQA